MAERAVASGFFGAFEVEQAAFFEVNEDGLGGTTEQARGQGLKMGVVPDYEYGLARTGQAEGHGAGVVLGPQTGGFHQRGGEFEFFLEDFGALDGADKGAVPNLADVQFDLVLAQVGGQMLDLFFALAGQAPGGVRLPRFGFRMSQQV